MKEFFELNLGSMEMDEYEKRFFEPLKYVGFIKDENVKFQIFMSRLASFYSDKIHYDNPRTLEEAIRRQNTFMSRADQGQSSKNHGMTR
jgi:hypothetical protein